MSTFTTPPSRFADKGKWVEGKVQDWMDERNKHSAVFAYHRMPDARAARGSLAPQPADWLFSEQRDHREPFIGWLEAKETAETTRLPKTKIRQYGKLLMFHLAGMQARVIVYRTTSNDWLVLDNLHLFGDTSKSSFPFKGLVVYPTWAEALQEMFNV